MSTAPAVPTARQCVDEAVAEPSSKHASRARPHAFTVVSRSGKEFIFAAETREERDKVRAQCVSLLRTRARVRRGFACMCARELSRSNEPIRARACACVRARACALRCLGVPLEYP